MAERNLAGARSVSKTMLLVLVADSEETALAIGSHVFENIDICDSTWFCIGYLDESLTFTPTMEAILDKK